MRKSIKISVLMACHNRRNSTLACLKSLQQQSILYDFDTGMEYLLELWLLDDASSDGTVEHTLKIWPAANIIPGDGARYWCGGMREAWKHALPSDPDFFLLLNDDTFLLPHALRSLLAITPDSDMPIIAVSSIADPDTGEIVFGGRRGRVASIVKVRGIQEDCDTMNANCVLVPRVVVQRIGIFHHSYTHAMGDFDYGYAARRAGIRVIASGDVLGFSKPNPATNTWRDKSLSRRERFRLLWFSPKGLPLVEWATYARRNLGWTWPYRILSPALRIIAGR